MDDLPEYSIFSNRQSEQIDALPIAPAYPDSEPIFSYFNEPSPSSSVEDYLPRSGWDFDSETLDSLTQIVPKTHNFNDDPI